MVANSGQPHWVNVVAAHLSFYFPNSLCIWELLYILLLGSMFYYCKPPGEPMAGQPPSSCLPLTAHRLYLLCDRRHILIYKVYSVWCIYFSMVWLHVYIHIQSCGSWIWCVYWTSLSIHTLYYIVIQYISILLLYVYVKLYML